MRLRNVYIGLLGVVLLIGALLFFNWNHVTDFFYFSKNNITKEVKENPHYYKDIDETKYLVYFYSKDCKSCEDYTSSLKEYEKKKEGLTIYKVNLDKFTQTEVENQFFMANGIPHLIYITENEERFRYIGVHPIENLPTMMSDGIQGTL